MEAAQAAQQTEELAEAEENIKQINGEEHPKGQTGIRSGLKKMLGRDYYLQLFTRL